MNIHILGIGGIGFWLTVGLARHYDMKKVTLWDEDTFSGGLGYQRLPFASPTDLKVEVCRAFLYSVLVTDALPVVVPKRFTGNGSPLCWNDTLIVDCTDMPLTQRKGMWTRARKHGATMMRVSYDGHGSIVVCSSGLPLAGTKDGGYAHVPTLALSLAAGGYGAECVLQFVHERLRLPFDIQFQLPLIEEASTHVE